MSSAPAQAVKVVKVVKAVKAVKAAKAPLAVKPVAKKDLPKADKVVRADLPALAKVAMALHLLMAVHQYFSRNMLTSSLTATSPSESLKG